VGVVMRTMGPVVLARIGIDFGAGDIAVVVTEPKLVETGTEDVLELRITHFTRFAELIPFSRVEEGMDRTAEIVRKVALRAWRTEVFVDASSLGRYASTILREKLRETGARIVEVQITSGGTPVEKGPVWRVPRLVLLENLSGMIATGGLVIPGELTLLVHQLKSLRARISAARRLSVEPGPGADDDLVMALALAVWKRVYESELEFPPRKRVIEAI